MNGAVTIENAAEIVLEDVSVAESPTAGVSIVNANVTISDSSISGSSGPGIVASGNSTVTVSGTSYMGNLGGAEVGPDSSFRDLTLARLSLDQEYIGRAGDPGAQTANVLVDLSADATIALSILFPDGCSSRIAGGLYRAGHYEFPLEPVIGECVRALGAALGIDAPYVVTLQAANETGDIDVSVEAYVDESGVDAVPSTISAVVNPRPGTRIVIRDGETVTISRAEPSFVAHGYRSVYGGYSYCTPLPAGGDFALYVDGVLMPSVYEEPAYTWGACTMHTFAWITEFPANTLHVGTHSFTGVWDHRDYHIERTTTVVVTE